MDFDEYQGQVEETDESKKRIISLLGLVGEIGDLNSVIKNSVAQGGDYPNLRNEITEELGDILWYLANIASRYKIQLSEVAGRNIDKAKRFHTPGSYCQYDVNEAEDERFPRQFKVIFEEKELGKGIQVKINVNGVFVGDALTDNSHQDDGYRYHDAFHLAYAAILGWSPVTRALLRRKRKSKPRIDEVEDGARAIIVEEAIALLVFNESKVRGGFVEESSIHLSLIKIIMKLCGELEVQSCTAMQWRTAIHNGYKVFRCLKDNLGGEVVLDLDTRKISCTPLIN